MGYQTDGDMGYQTDYDIGNGIPDDGYRSTARAISCQAAGFSSPVSLSIRSPGSNPIIELFGQQADCREPRRRNRTDGDIGYQTGLRYRQWDA